mmetsp:Transcript_40/g.114  ORF Transcript_40/g.114 Transcript_40/m.114 type:complete len:524 (-) Transcript_40:214-1785(-)
MGEAPEGATLCGGARVGKKRKGRSEAAKEAKGGVSRKKKTNKKGKKKVKHHERSASNAGVSTTEVVSCRRAGTDGQSKQRDTFSVAAGSRRGGGAEGVSKAGHPQIWDPSVEPSRQVLAVVACAGSWQRTSLAMELKRQQLMQVLHRKLQDSCRQLGVRYVNKMLESWVLQQSAGEPSDPVLGGAAASPEALVAELREAGAPETGAARAASELCKLAKNLISQVQQMRPGGPQPRVEVFDIEHGGKKARQALLERQGNPKALQGKELVVGHTKLRINQEHLEKLEELHRRHSSPKNATWDEFLQRVCSLLVRYNTLQGGSCHGGGMQAALTEEAFAILHDRMGATMECFASPLNCYWGCYCSAFPDTDAPFGSVGSFFSFHPTEGSFEANPPFVPSVMKRMAEHIHSLLCKSTGPMSFCVIIPAWSSTEGWRSLEQSQFLRASLTVSQKEHGFCEGLQHSQATRYRIATFDSSMFFLQNDAGNERWPPSACVCEALRQAMHSKHCTVAQQMAAKRGGSTELAA